MAMLLQIDEQFFDFVGFIGGFTCQSCSTMGLKEGKFDIRFIPFIKGLDQMVHLTERRVLQFYVIENVPGMLESIGDEPLISEWVSKVLKRRLPHFVNYM